MIKYAFFLLSTCYVFSVSGQVSYEFAAPVPPNAQAIQMVNSMYYGTYSSDESAVSYEFSEAGIFAVSINLMSMSKKTIRESSQYDVRNGYIFGIVEDSLPCVLKDNTYFFGVHNRVQIAGGSSQNVLTSLKTGEYVLNYSENGHYIPLFFSFKGKQLNVRDFDYPMDTEQFTAIKDQLKMNRALQVVVLNPTFEEWQRLSLSSMQGTQQVFKKN